MKGRCGDQGDTWPYGRCLDASKMRRRAVGPDRTGGEVLDPDREAGKGHGRLRPEVAPSALPTTYIHRIRVVLARAGDQGPRQSAAPRGRPCANDRGTASLRNGRRSCLVSAGVGGGHGDVGTGCTEWSKAERHVRRRGGGGYDGTMTGEGCRGRGLVLARVSRVGRILVCWAVCHVDGRGRVRGQRLNEQQAKDDDVA